MKRGAWLVLVLPALGGLALGACRGRALVAGPADAGAGPSDASADAAAPPFPGRAFDVTAMLDVAAPHGEEGGWTDFPKTFAFTLVLEDDGRRVLVASKGTAASADASTISNGALETAFALTLPYARSCTGRATLAFDEVILLAPSGEIKGTARGKVTYQNGDDFWSATLTAGFDGADDHTVPSLTLPTEPVDPLAPPSFVATEPLPPTVTAKLVGAASGDVVVLAPSRLAGPERAIAGFAAPDVALRAGETYTLRVDGLIDFAGNANAAPPATFTTSAAPPLAAPDGFESLTGDSFGGAGLLAEGPLTAIAGGKSLLLNTGFGGGFGFLPYALGPSLAVRLVVPAGATHVRFDRQLIAPDSTQGSMFVGAIRVASVGHPVAATMNLAATDFMKQTLAGNGDVYVSPVATIELPLPPGATDELTFEIAGVTFQCGLPPPPTVLVVDNLRVE